MSLALSETTTTGFVATRPINKEDIHLSQVTRYRYIDILSWQPRVTTTSCLAYKVFKDLLSIYHLCINPIRKIGADRINTQVVFSIRVMPSGVYKLMFYLAIIVNKILRHCHSWLARQCMPRHLVPEPLSMFLLHVCPRRLFHIGRRSSKGFVLLYICFKTNQY